MLIKILIIQTFLFKVLYFIKKKMKIIIINKSWKNNKKLQIKKITFNKILFKIYLKKIMNNKMKIIHKKKEN
jgi:hypothetical protein